MALRPQTRYVTPHTWFRYFAYQQDNSLCIAPHLLLNGKATKQTLAKLKLGYDPLIFQKDYVSRYMPVFQSPLVLVPLLVHLVLLALLIQSLVFIVSN